PCGVSAGAAAAPIPAGQKISPEREAVSRGLTACGYVLCGTGSGSRCRAVPRREATDYVVNLSKSVFCQDARACARTVAALAHHRDRSRAVQLAQLFFQVRKRNVHKTWCVPSAEFARPAHIEQLQLRALVELLTKLIHRHLRNGLHGFSGFIPGIHTATQVSLDA